MTSRTPERIRQHLEALCAAGASPGLQYTAVGRAGEFVSHAVGNADVGSGTAMTVSTRLMAYSMSKTLTAAAVLKLAATGRLELDAPADRYLNLPYGPEVTVRRLLCHTAGLPNPIPLRWVHLPAEHAAFDEHAVLKAIVARYSRLAAVPGTRFRYTNLGYWLLGPIVEICSGHAFGDYVRQELLQPLGIGAEQLGYEMTPGVAMASGYLEKWSWLNLLKRLVIDARYVDRYEGRWLKIRAHYPNGPAFGGLIGTTAALGRWLGDLLGESRVLPPAAVGWLFEQQRLSSGAPVPMTLGWHIGEAAGGRFYFKEGGGGGFHSMMRLYPERGVASVIIGNATAFPARRALDELDRLLV